MARFQGQSLQRWHACVYTASIISLLIRTYNAHMYTHVPVDPLPCSEILRAAFIEMSWQKHAAKAHRSSA